MVSDAGNQGMSEREEQCTEICAALCYSIRRVLEPTPYRSPHSPFPKESPHLSRWDDFRNQNVFCGVSHISLLQNRFWVSPCCMPVLAELNHHAFLGQWIQSYSSMVATVCATCWLSHTWVLSSYTYPLTPWPSPSGIGLRLLLTC